MFETAVDTKCFPLSYNLDDVEPGQQPHPDIYCDFPTCTRETEAMPVLLLHFRLAKCSFQKMLKFLCSTVH